MIPPSWGCARSRCDRSAGQGILDSAHISLALDNTLTVCDTCAFFDIWELRWALIEE